MSFSTDNIDSDDTKLSLDLPFLDSYQYKNNDLEKRVFIDNEESLNIRESVIQFLTDIRIIIHNAPEDARKELTRYFRSWKLWLMHKFNYVYKEDLEIDYEGYSSSRIHKNIMEDSAAAYLSKFNAAENDGLEKILELSDSDVVTFDADMYRFDLRRDHNAYLAERCIDVRNLILSVELPLALQNLAAICDSINDMAAPSNYEQYLHSWAFHMKGNAYQIAGFPTIAAFKFYESLKLKEKINVPLIHTVQSYTRLAIALAFVDALRAQSMLESLWDYIVSRSSVKRKLEEQSEWHYGNLISDLNLARGNWQFVNANKKLARELLLNSYEHAMKTDSKTRQLSAQISLGVIGHKQAESEISSLLSSVSESSVMTRYIERVALHHNMVILERYNIDFAKSLQYSLRKFNGIASRPKNLEIS